MEEKNALGRDTYTSHISVGSEINSIAKLVYPVSA